MTRLVQIFIQAPRLSFGHSWSDLKGFFRPNGGLIASGHGAGRGRNGGFQPMRARLVGGMAFVIPLTEGECGEGLSGGLARIALE